ncbi:VOC family protein [Nodosilinea sp. LEGE 06152]|uniref:VOC family protein n=1 Tax=Nodosilinea sp. LEGE 06152 TaxID=2777966 RepID=UPI001D1416E9|nr:VOC family protein [Nodosilinea sp. LEGE 06152]
MQEKYSMQNTNSEFKIMGLNHVALVCKDMERTVEFYTNVLGMKLIKAFDLPAGLGQHFFFDMGEGECIAFFWFPEAAERQPGLSNPRGSLDMAVDFNDPASLVSSHGSMNHFAFNVPAENIEAYRQKLIEKGVQVSPVIHHDNSPMQASDQVNDQTFVSSIYFQDPDGIVLEFAGWHREFSTLYGDTTDCQPATPKDVEKYRAAGRAFAMSMAAANA